MGDYRYVHVLEPLTILLTLFKSILVKITIACRLFSLSRRRQMADKFSS